MLHTLISGIYFMSSPDSHYYRINMPTGMACTPPHQKITVHYITGQFHGKCQLDDQALTELIICHVLRRPL